MRRSGAQAALRSSTDDGGVEHITGASKGADEILPVAFAEFAAQAAGVTVEGEGLAGGARGPQASRRSSSLLNTPVGSEADAQESEVFLRQVDLAVADRDFPSAGSISSSPIRTGPSRRLWPRRRMAVILARVSP